jgi:hypothetical protein
MTATVTPHPWSEDALVAKALLYVERMESHTADDWEFGFWSALTLEFVARAALAHISPVLLADLKDWRNVTHALGADPTAKKFSPTSIGTTEVLRRLQELLPKFTPELVGFCTQHADRRNSELHSGDSAFASLGTSEWLPRFYSACKVLLESMGRQLSDLIADPNAAQAMIDSLEDAAAKAVEQDIRAHAQVWRSKEEEERGKATVQANAWATRQAGHRVSCPACNSPALVQGSPSGTVTTAVDEDEVVQRQTMLPASFECIACGLRIHGLSKLSACKLGDAFTAKSTYSAAEFFGLYTEDDIEEARAEYPEAEPDFNEY